MIFAKKNDKIACKALALASFSLMTLAVWVCVPVGRSILFAKDTQVMNKPVMNYKDQPDSYWKEKLTPGQYYILRKKGTERAFTGKFHDNKAPGVYRCAGCGLELFSSEHKFDSGTGWPSFWAPIQMKNTATQTDRSLFSTRTEVLCNRCGGHLGHVFEDGPPPTGKRFCINSDALTFEKK